MGKRKPPNNPPQEICDKCGGSGIVDKWFGPFLLELPEQYRNNLIDRLKRRHTILEHIDKSMPRLTVDNMKKNWSRDGLIKRCTSDLKAAGVALNNKDFESAAGNWLRVVMTLIYLVESYDDIPIPDEKPDKSNG